AGLVSNHGPACNASRHETLAPTIAANRVLPRTNPRPPRRFGKIPAREPRLASKEPIDCCSTYTPNCRKRAHTGAGAAPDTLAKRTGYRALRPATGRPARVAQRLCDPAWRPGCGQDHAGAPLVARPGRTGPHQEP